MNNTLSRMVSSSKHQDVYKLINVSFDDGYMSPH